MPVVLFALAGTIAAGDAGAQTDSTELIRRGQRVYEKKECARCHGIDVTGSGPTLGGVTQRRSREWLYGWLNKSKDMARQDSTAKALVEIYSYVMPNQRLSREDVDAVLAFIEHRAVKLREEAGMQ
jgi:mono/diheme cytochrome c family protein